MKNKFHRQVIEVELFLTKEIKLIPGNRYSFPFFQELYDEELKYVGDLLENESFNFLGNFVFFGDELFMGISTNSQGKYWVRFDESIKVRV